MDQKSRKKDRWFWSNFSMSMDNKIGLVTQAMGVNFSEIWIRIICTLRNKLNHMKFCDNRVATNRTTLYSQNNVIMCVIASQITSLTIVYSTVYSDADQRNIKAPRHWPLCGEFTVDRWIPRTKGQLRWKWFHLMTSSCYAIHFGFLKSQREAFSTWILTLFPAWISNHMLSKL